MTEEFPAVVRRWKNVQVGDVVLIGVPLEMLRVTKITPGENILGRAKRYIDVEPPGNSGGWRSYLHWDDDYATVIVKEGLQMRLLSLRRRLRRSIRRGERRLKAGKRLVTLDEVTGRKKGK